MTIGNIFFDQWQPWQYGLQYASKAFQNRMCISLHFTARNRQINEMDMKLL